jgi:ribosomal protein S12
LGYLLTATSFDPALTDNILKYVPTKGSTHLLEKPTIVVIADAEMKNIPFVYVDVL